MKLNEFRSIGSGKPCFVVAEIGQNHNGCLETAKRLILEAKEAGVDCVKFQKSNLEAKFTKSALNRRYESRHAFGGTYGEHKRALEFTLEQFRELKTFSEAAGVMFSASAMDEASFWDLESLHLDWIKIGSGDSSNFPMLRAISAGSKTPLIVSTGMTTEAGLWKMKEALGESRYAVLHCISAYPLEPEDVQLEFMAQLEEIFEGHVVGYSGHETGIAVSLGAVIKGAKVVERHFTLDKGQKGSDHACSLTPSEMRELVQGIRRIEALELPKLDNPQVVEVIRSLGVPEADCRGLKKALGPLRGARRLFDCEKPCWDKLGKSLVYSRDLDLGHVLTPGDLFVKVSEPKGLDPGLEGEVVGQKLLKSVLKDDPVSFHDLVDFQRTSTS